MRTYLLKGARCLILDPPGVVEGDLLVENGRIRRVTKDSALPEGVEVIDLTGKYLISGLVCAHTHLYSALARGMPGPASPPEDFVQILERVWWRLDRALDEESLYYSALVGAMEAVRSGTTCLIDHNASPGFIRGSLDTILRALQEVGVRGVLCYEITDRGGWGERDEGLMESSAFLNSFRSGGTGGQYRGLVGAHASFTLSDNTLENCRALVREFNTGFHIHVAEDAFDESHAREQFGCSVIERLDRFDLLNERTILAHGVHLSENEIAAIQHAGSWLVHNPRSNLNNSVGRAPVERFGDRVALGTDGIGADMFEESKFAFFKARESVEDAHAETYLQILNNGQRIISGLFESSFGLTESGAVADLVILDYRPPTPLTSDNLAWHWMFGINATHVESVMVGGRFIYRDRSFTSVNQNSIFDRAQKVAANLWMRMQNA